MDVKDIVINAIHKYAPTAINMHKIDNNFIMDMEIVYQNLEFEIYSKLKQNPQFPATFIVMNQKTRNNLITHILKNVDPSWNLGSFKYRGLDVLISDYVKDNEFKVG